MIELKLSEIWVYPVKALGGISLPSAKVLPKGLEYDRRWMLVDENATFLTQRNYPKLALFKSAFEKNHLIIYFEQDHVEVPLIVNTTTGMDARIWGDTVTTFEVSPIISDWFSERLDIQCKLVFFPEKNPRPVDPTYSLNQDQTSLSDGFPFLIIGQAALVDLNSRLEKSIPMNRFRPNFVFTGGEPFAEDRWKEFEIGTNRFAAVKPCGRCVVTTVDQDTAETKSEPLRTLSAYRKRNGKVLFGQNVIAIDYGEVHVGDLIHVKDASQK
jgi:uncharacterized protein YcbX